MTTTTWPPGASDVTAEPAKLNVMPVVKATCARSSVRLGLMFRSSMNSKSFLSVPAACSAGVAGPSGWKWISETTRLPASSSTPAAAVAVNSTGADQWLQRPLLSCIRTRAR